MGFLKAVFLFLRTWFVSKSDLAAENLALRQQLAVMSHSIKRPKLRVRDRVFWIWLMRLWPLWRSALLIVKPETVVRWLWLPKTPSDQIRGNHETFPSRVLAWPALVA